MRVLFAVIAILALLFIVPSAMTFRLILGAAP